MTTTNNLPESILQGNAAVIPFTFRNNITGALVDPTVVTCQVYDAEFNETTYTYGVGTVITKVSTGTYYATVDCSNASFVGTCVINVISDPDGTSPVVCQSASTASWIVTPLPN